MPNRSMFPTCHSIPSALERSLTRPDSSRARSRIEPLERLEGLLQALETELARPTARSARRARLFLGSYALLFVLLALRFRSTPMQVACGALALVGIADMMWIVFGVSARTAPEPVKLAAIVDAGPQVAGYLTTYLLPFLTVAEPAPRDIATPS